MLASRYSVMKNSGTNRLADIVLISTTHREPSSMSIMGGVGVKCMCSCVCVHARMHAFFGDSRC